MTANKPSILKVHSLSIHTDSEKENAIIEDFSLEIKEGEIVGLFGDSGSGKTLSMLSLIGLVPSTLHISKTVSYFINGEENRVEDQASESFYRTIRSNEVAFVFQQAASCLNPLLRVRKQIEEGVANKEEEGQNLAEHYMRLLGFDDPKSILKAYPHELSVGATTESHVGSGLNKETKTYNS